MNIIAMIILFDNLNYLCILFIHMLFIHIVLQRESFRLKESQTSL
jgi:hypothetical protein